MLLFEWEAEGLEDFVDETRDQNDQLIAVFKLLSGHFQACLVLLDGSFELVYLLALFVSQLHF